MLVIVSPALLVKGLAVNPGVPQCSSRGMPHLTWSFPEHARRVEDDEPGKSGVCLRGFPSNWKKIPLKCQTSCILQVSCLLNLFLRKAYNSDALQWVIQVGIQTFKLLEHVVHGLDI